MENETEIFGKRGKFSMAKKAKCGEEFGKFEKM